jgi:hypothetical protein
LPIADWQFADLKAKVLIEPLAGLTLNPSQIGNWQSEIGNVHVDR